MGTFDASKVRMKKTQALSLMWKQLYFRGSSRVRKQLTLPYYMRSDVNTQIVSPTLCTADPSVMGD